MRILKNNFVTNEQLQKLRSMRLALPLAADISHAVITVYLRDLDVKNIVVFSSEKPATQYINKAPLLTGRKIRMVEEPLVERVLKTGLVLSGKREWELGSFLYTKIYPVTDALGNCFAAIAFETDPGDNLERYEIFIEQAFSLLKNAETSFFKNENYKRLTSTEGMMVVDSEKRVIAANNNAQHIFRVLGVSQLIGLRTSGIQINWPLVSMVLKAGIAESKEYLMRGLNIAMRVIPIEPRKESNTAIVVFSDVTELKKKDEELLIKSVVIKEIHHRVKNNLQTIASLLRLQARRTKVEETKAILHDSINRVNSIAIVHDYLSKGNDDSFDVKQAVRGIYKELLNSMVRPELKLKTSFEMEDINIPSQKANDIALVFNELLQNSLEHGFANLSEGKIDVRFRENEDSYTLEIQDDGEGLPENFDINKTNSLGLKIIQTIVSADLKGSFELISLEKGTLARVVVPKEG